MLKALFDWVNLRAPLDSPSSHTGHANTAKYVTDVSQKAVAHVIPLLGQVHAHSGVHALAGVIQQAPTDQGTLDAVALTYAMVKA